MTSLVQVITINGVASLWITSENYLPFVTH